ncbi:PQQ-dependent sugar dehydrogenase [Tahibacter amnicola]|uniref:PQQ-dependent sugar dehydrogenase n=1 Tax=Tahibacter amnicola TaxID=2976241 RepID=A0ABY6BAD6_9GAMM|nr:PQQ-dependent sugar dehydrogenase [Tahibacter amnicola]UXI67023.1 PQQ-dependent sugar dehydrogenase [Tahibacter amnicola]
MSAYRWIMAWVFGLCVQTAGAQAPPSAFVTDFVYGSQYGFTSIVFDHAGRLLVAEKRGRVVLLAPNGSGGFVTPATTFADLLSSVDASAECGLLGLALDPDYANTRYVYFFYSTPTDQRLTRATVNATYTAVVPGSEIVLLSGLPRESNAHKAGDIQFRPGDPTSIYISLGDDGRRERSQDLTFYNGKMLRVDAATGRGLADNPYYDGDPLSVRSRIWAIGFRNPFRFTFHPTGGPANVMYSSENGDATDRLSFVRRGSNGAWGPGGDSGGFLNPPDANHRVLTTLNPAVVGVAISPSGPFGTNVIYWAQWQRNIRRYQLSGANLDTATALDGGANFKSGTAMTIDLEFGPDGHLYGTWTGGGNDAGDLHRIRYVGSPPPVAAFATTPSPPSGQAPLAVQFTDQSTAPGSSISSRQWTFGDGAQSTATNPSHTYTQAGDYTATLTVTNAVGQQSSTTRAVRATRAVQLQITGTVRDGRSLAAPGLAAPTELRVYLANGVTPLAVSGGAGPDGNIIAIPAGGAINVTANVSLPGDALVLSAGEPTGDGVQPARRGYPIPAGAGPHPISAHFHLSDTQVAGRVRDTRGTPLAVDVGVRRGASAYAVAGGRDFLPGHGHPASGVNHRVTSDGLGWYHLPLRAADAGTPFTVDVVADTGYATHARITATRTISAGTLEMLDLTPGLWSGGQACDELSAIPATPAVNYATAIQPIWNAACIGCHAPAATNSGGLDLTGAGSQAALVGVGSSGAPGVPRVSSGQPLRSYLMEKINCANPQSGTRMRPTDAMSLANQALIRDWISQLPPQQDGIFSDGFEP